MHCCRLHNWPLKHCCATLNSVTKLTMTHNSTTKHTECIVVFLVQRLYERATMLRCTISIAKPTRCTNVSNLFYFGMTLCMFRTVFPSIISSSKLYIQQPNRYCCLLASKQTAVSVWQTPVAVCLLASRQQYLFWQMPVTVCLLASRQQYLFDKRLLLFAC